jgi:signal transduction histidine kinase
VQRALTLIQARGLDGAKAELQSKSTGFVDRDLYVFVLDRAGHYLVHGAKPEMQGRLIQSMPGIDGDRFIRDVWQVADQGGWVDYEITNPDTGTVQPKASFMKAIGNDRVVGCGVYRQTSDLPG